MILCYTDAAKLTGVKEKTSMVRLGLEALIAKESARRLRGSRSKKGSFAGFEDRRPRSLA